MRKNQAQAEGDRKEREMMKEMKKKNEELEGKNKNMKRLKSVLEKKEAENREIKAQWEKEVDLVSKQGRVNLDTMSRLEKSQSDLQQQSDKVRELERQ